MSAALIAVCAWALVANVLAMVPSKDNHWSRAYMLSASGCPSLVWATWQHGVWIGLLVLAAGASVLRWPVRHFWIWLRRAGRLKNE